MPTIFAADIESYKEDQNCVLRAMILGHKTETTHKLLSNSKLALLVNLRRGHI